jgi:hypothetical protein
MTRKINAMSQTSMDMLKTRNNGQEETGVVKKIGISRLTEYAIGGNDAVSVNNVSNRCILDDKALDCEYCSIRHLKSNDNSTNPFVINIDDDDVTDSISSQFPVEVSWEGETILRKRQTIGDIMENKLGTRSKICFDSTRNTKLLPACRIVKRVEEENKAQAKEKRSKSEYLQTMIEVDYQLASDLIQSSDPESKEIGKRLRLYVAKVRLATYVGTESENEDGKSHVNVVNIDDGKRDQSFCDRN